MSIFTRRRFLKTSLLGFILGVFSKKSIALSPTPAETEGPFYPIRPKKYKDFDLTLIAGNTEPAKGEVVYIHGRVIDENANAIEDATVEIWQANAAGRYQHPHDSNPAPVDDNFQGWAIVKSGKNGLFKFKTILSGAYRVSKTWVRPPHIHFKIVRRRYNELITQMYFPGNDLNKKDYLLKTKPKQSKAL